MPVSMWRYWNMFPFNLETLWCFVYVSYAYDVLVLLVNGRGRDIAMLNPTLNIILGAVWKIEMLKDLTYLWTNKKYDTCGKSKTCGRTEGNNVHEHIFCFTKPNVKPQTILRLNTMSWKGKFHIHTHEQLKLKKKKRNMRNTNDLA